jgi:hypothetical protein
MRLESVRSAVEVGEKRTRSAINDSLDYEMAMSDLKRAT